jgi:hypothetical protein
LFVLFAVAACGGIVVCRTNLSAEQERQENQAVLNPMVNAEKFQVGFHFILAGNEKQEAAEWCVRILYKVLLCFRPEGAIRDSIVQRTMSAFLSIFNPVRATRHRYFQGVAPFQGFVSFGGY